jgi:hypothetical protein
LPRWLTDDVHPVPQRHGAVESDVFERRIFRPGGGS